MRNVILLVVAVSAAVSSVALAENTLVQRESAAAQAVKAVKPVQQKASKAVRLSDAELDKISAGDAQVFNGGGLTLVFNPGNAQVLKFNKNHIVCINCF